MDGCLEAKQKGIIKKVGVSCHNLDAYKTAAEGSWADVIIAQINLFGSRMGNTGRVNANA